MQKVKTQFDPHNAENSVTKVISCTPRKALTEIYVFISNVNAITLG